MSRKASQNWLYLQFDDNHKEPLHSSNYLHKSR